MLDFTDQKRSNVPIKQEPLTISWGLNLMIGLVGALLLTGVGLWRAESSATDARIDHQQAEIDWLTKQTITNSDHIDAHSAALAALQQQADADSQRIEQNEQKENTLDFAMHALSDAVNRLAENKKFR